MRVGVFDVSVNLPKPEVLKVSLGSELQNQMPPSVPSALMVMRVIAPSTAQTSSVARSPLVSSHVLRSPARFFASSMSISERVSSAVVDGELHQSAGVGVDGGFAQLRRVHLAQALEAGDVDLALDLLAFDRSSSRRFSSSSSA
jgi:hypothetical protein